MGSSFSIVSLPAGAPPRDSIGPLPAGPPAHLGQRSPPPTSTAAGAAALTALVAWGSIARSGAPAWRRHRGISKPLPTVAMKQTGIAPPQVAEEVVDAQGIIRCISDLPREEALGLQLCSCQALAGPVSVKNGCFTAQPVQIKHSLGDDTTKNMEVVRESVRKLVDHYNWQGPIGCSTTTQVARSLGLPCNSVSDIESCMTAFLTESLRKHYVSFVHGMLDTTAAGYTELVWGEVQNDEFWRGKAVLICTLGKNLGCVLFKDGRRVYHPEWCHVHAEACGADAAKGEECPPQVCEVELPSWPLINDERAEFTPPQQGDPRYGEWTAFVDMQLSTTMEAVAMLDKVIIMPGGHAAERSFPMVESLRPELTRTNSLAAEMGCEVIAIEQSEGSVPRGAALGALVELETTQVLKQLKKMLTKADSLQSLSHSQIRRMFDHLDSRYQGKIKAEELIEGLEQMGLQRDMKSLLQEMGTSEGEAISVERFIEWWEVNVKQAKVVTLTSAGAWRRFLGSMPEEGLGDFILLEVSYTYCRVCRGFESAFRRYAKANPDIRFVQLLGNGTIGAQEFTKYELKVEKSPAFYLFKRGEEKPLLSWTGANKARFEEKLQQIRKM